MDDTAGETGKDGLSRRSMIRRAAAAGAIAWSAPVIIDSLTSPAAAATACTGPCYRFGIRAAAIGTACPVNTKNLTAPPSDCQPAEPCATPVEPNASGGSYLPFYGITYNTTLSANNCTISGSTCTGGTATTECWVPSGAGATQLNVKRVWDVNIATFTSRIPLTTCASPDLYAAVAGVNDRDNVSCCGVSNYPGSPYSGTATTCQPSGFNNSATLTGGPSSYQVTWIFDANNQANASQSGTYQFTIGCACV